MISVFDMTYELKLKYVIKHKKDHFGDYTYMSPVLEGYVNFFCNDRYNHSPHESPHKAIPYLYSHIS